MATFFGYFIATIVMVIFASIAIGAIKTKDKQRKNGD